MIDKVGVVIIKRLHRLVLHGFRPWLGYSEASGEVENIHLRRRDQVASIMADGAVWFVFKVPLAYPRADRDGILHSEAFAIFGDDAENFDALFKPVANLPRRGLLVQRLYEFGF